MKKNKAEVSQKEKRVGKTIDEMTYFDDEFFNACMQNNPDAALLILRVVLRKPDLVFVSEPMIQKTIKDFGHKSIRVDLYCESEKKYMAVEMQQQNSGAEPRRVRYYSSLIDATTTVAGDDYRDLPDIYVIFITRYDYRGYGEPYHEYRYVDYVTGEELNDGSHLLYVNGAYKGDDDFGRLMHDLRCTNPYEMYHDELKKPALFFKGTNEGRTTMGDAVRKLLDENTKEVTESVTKEVTETVTKEVKKQDKEDMAKRMILKGKYSIDEIAEISDLPLETVLKLQSEMNKK